MCISMSHQKKAFLQSKIRENADLLYILGPFRGITEGHESTVGQDGEHDQHAEHRRDKVKEHIGAFMLQYNQT